MLNNPFTAPSEPEVFAYGFPTTIGDTVTIGGIEYLIVHNDTANSHLYLCKKYWDSTENTNFENSNRPSYNGSIIHAKCKTYYNGKIPEKIKPLLVTLSCGYGCPVFIPTRQQVGGSSDTGNSNILDGDWSYFNSVSSRKFTNSSGASTGWWLQSNKPYDSSYLCCVGYNGYVDYCGPSNKLGFRPCFAIKYNSLS